ncbi:hypothetical protein [Aquidulcibacter sp.]|uniref:hypothetical protein n=1 Tax=Aquidulcibacter sp. TaxID=2052990 RepID=UPI0025C262D9|nr:hypothetical protein [Aquidulcibacter sp.]MCA3692610.1 hypothetical protein [Aquidulcibacter sp.]
MIHIQIKEADLAKEALDAAEEASKKLDGLPQDKVKDFIDGNAKVWKAFRESLANVSHKKCWFTEARDDGALPDVDHFRPKGRFKAPDHEHEGYPWLAFDWRNFRLSSQRSNRWNTDEKTGERVGKNSAFPLIDGSPRATWANRCEADELPILLDPTCPDDVELIDIQDDGSVIPATGCTSEEAKRVRASIQLLGLNLPPFKEGRREIIRSVKVEIKRIRDKIGGDLRNKTETSVAAEKARLSGFRHPRSIYSRAANAAIDRSAKSLPAA